MKSTTVVPNAMRLAENVARAIFDFSYKAVYGDPHYGVHDLLLFGSTLTEQSPHDIDLLVVHNMNLLGELGIATQYDVKQGRCVPDPKAKIEKGDNYCASRILEAMGSPEFEDWIEFKGKIGDLEREDLHNLSKSGGRYGGTVDLPYVGEIQIAENSDIRAVFDQIEAASQPVIQRYNAGRVFVKVEGLLKPLGLEVDDVLDMHAMERRLLIEDELSHEKGDERQIVIGQCRDPTFWQSVLRTGRLYDKERGTFSVPVEQKYPGVVELFTPARAA